MIKVNELFSGIGAFRKALERLNIPHEIVGISEIDKYAIKSYEAIYGATRNYGDISKVDKLDYADLWTYGFPCQDISVPGQQKGIIKGETRSGLLYEVQRLLTTSAMDNELPKYLILENVKNLVGKKFKADFDGWLDWLDGIGYNNYWQVLNAKDYGIPQNRERVFVVSIRKDIDKGFSFPQPVPLNTTMADFLEDEVDEKYYISDTYIKYAERVTAEQKEKGNNLKFLPQERESIAKTITSKAGQRITDNFIKENIPLNPHDDGTCRTIKAQYAKSSYANFTRTNGFGETGVLEIKEQKDYLPLALDEQNKNIRTDGTVGTIMTDGSSPKHNNRVIESNHRIRKLTPRECWRLMGFDDTDFDNAEKVCSNTQLYKQAGNSIVVNVLENILNGLL